MQRLVLVAAVAAMLSACAVTPAVTTISPAPSDLQKPGWQAVVSAEDQDRLAHLPGIWRSALEAVPRRYHRLVTREGDLLVAGAARERPATPPGSYRCRLVRLGAGAGGEPPVQSFPDFFCYVRAEHDNLLSFTKQTGTDLPGGWIYDDTDRRLVLAGAKQRAVGDNSLGYGAEPDRDLVGVIERIGPFRWRLVLPWRGERPGLDIYELTPVPLEQQAAEPPASPDSP